MNRFLAVLLLMIPVILIAQPAPDTLWTRTFGGAGDDVPRAIRQTADGGYVIAGLTTSFGNGQWDIWVIKLNASGESVWQRTYGGAYDDAGNDIRQLPDGGYVVAGGRWPTSAIIERSHILRLDADGDSLWMQMYGDTVSQTCKGVAALGDSIFCMMESATPFSRQLRMVSAMSGETINLTSDWGGGGGSNGVDYVYSDIESESSGTAFLSGYRDLWEVNLHGLRFDWITCQLYRLSPMGSVLWTYDSAGFISGPISPTHSMGCLLATGNNVAVLIDSAGTPTTSYPYAGTAVDIRAWFSGGFAILSTRTTPDNNIVLCAYDSTGSVLWQGTWGGAGNDQAVALESTSDSGYVIVGTTTSFGAGGTDIYVIKTDPHHWLYAGQRHESLPKSFSLMSYPNPFNPATTLSFTLPKAARTKVTVYDLQGREVKVLADEVMTAGEQKMRFDGSGLPSGIYFARVEAGEMTATQKMMLLK
jgi:hypothetical protein